MSILALDLGLNLGWATMTEDGARLCGTAVFSSPGNDIGRLVLAMRWWVGEMVEKHSITELVWEMPLHVTTNSLKALEITFTIQAGIALAGKELKLPKRRFDMGTVRNSIMGFSRAPKEIKGTETRRKWLKAQIVAHAIALGYSPDTDNAADAALNLQYALKISNGAGNEQQLLVG